MTTKELRETDANHWSNFQQRDALDHFIANLMEPKPAIVPLKAIRDKNDDRYNSAMQSSPSGWWSAEAGTDAEDSSGPDTRCSWHPRYRICRDDDMENKGAALEVFNKCVGKLKCIGAVEIFRCPDGPENWVIGAYDTDSNWHQVEAETLELAICLFAKKLFTK